MATYETAKDQFIQVDGISFAYRHLGASRGIPLVFIAGFRQTMDHWDPLLVNSLAAQRPVLLIDNAGVGRSQGEIPPTLAEWAAHYVNVLRALGHEKADVLGYSMGGAVAQLMALNAPDLARCLVLCATTASTGEGVILGAAEPTLMLRNAVTDEEQRQVFMKYMFIEGSQRSQSAGVEAWQRTSQARAQRSPHVPSDLSRRQSRAFGWFMKPENAHQASYQRLHELKIPVLIATGSNDIVIPTENSITLWKKMSHANAQLHLYPDSGHAFFSQYAEEFARLVNDFLGNATAPTTPTTPASSKL